MSRHRGTNVFALIAKGLTENHLGKIRTYPSGYSFGDAGYTTRSGVFLAPIKAADGRAVSLNGKRSARNCPTPPGDYPANPTRPEQHWVPMTICRKCPHHRARRRGQPYPCCAVLADIQRAGPSAAQQFVQLVDKAVHDAKEMMGQ